MHRRRHAEVGKPQHDPVVRRLHLQIRVVDRLAHPLRQRHSPRRVDASTERGVNHDAHRARLVAELFDDDVAIVRHHTGRRTLRRDVLDQRIGRRCVTGVFSGQSLFVWRFRQLSPQRADAMTEHQ